MLTRREFAIGASIGLAKAASKKMDEAAGPRFFVAALTALDQRGNLAEPVVKDYLAYLGATGVDGALVLGTTGEFASFSVKERRQILDCYARYRGKLALMAQVGAPNVP